MKKLLFLLLPFFSQAQSYRTVAYNTTFTPSAGKIVIRGASDWELQTPVISMISGLQTVLDSKAATISGTGYAKWSGTTPTFSATIPFADVSITDLDLGASNFFGWSGRSRMRSGTDGLITLYNNAETGFTALRFGGTGVTFPSLRLNGTQLEVKLADNSNFSNIKARDVISTQDVYGATIPGSASTPDSLLYRVPATGKFEVRKIPTASAAATLDLTNQTTVPSTPAAGHSTLFSRALPGTEIGVVDQTGDDFDLFKSFYSGHRAVWYVSTSGTTGSFTIFGTIGVTAGTITARNIGTGDAIAQMNKVGFSTGATASGGAGLRHNSAMYYRGGSAFLGGFHGKFKEMYSAASIAGRMGFVGFCSQGSTVIAAGTDPTTLTSMVGFVAKIATSNNWMVYSNDASGAATQAVDLGASFPANTNSTDPYDMRLFCKPNDTKITYWIRNMTSGAIATGDITTDLPPATTLMGWHIYITNGATASADIIDVISVEVTKPYN